VIWQPVVGLLAVPRMQQIFAVVAVDRIGVI
jgi:hypothetical protein